MAVTVTTSVLDFSGCVVASVSIYDLVLNVVLADLGRVSTVSISAEKSLLQWISTT